MTGYDTYESRLFGFMSERLFNVWLERQNLKKCEVPVVFLENIDWFMKIREFLERKFWGKSYEEGAVTGRRKGIETGVLKSSILLVKGMFS